MHQARTTPPGRHSPRQEEILAGLEEIFAREGIGVTVAQLAVRLSCSRRTLYELAPTKEDLFLLVLERMMGRLGRRARQAAAQEALPERRVAAFMQEGVVEFAGLENAFADAIADHPPAAELYARHLELARAFIVGTIELGVAEGRFAPGNPEVAATAIISAVRGMTDARFLNASGLSLSDALDELFAFAVRGLLARAA